MGESVTIKVDRHTVDWTQHQVVYQIRNRDGVWEDVPYERVFEDHGYLGYAWRRRLVHGVEPQEGRDG